MNVDRVLLSSVALYHDGKFLENGYMPMTETVDTYTAIL